LGKYEEDKHPNPPGLIPETSLERVEPSSLETGRPGMRPEPALLFKHPRGDYFSNAPTRFPSSEAMVKNA